MAELKILKKKIHGKEVSHDKVKPNDLVIKTSRTIIKGVTNLFG